MTKKRLLIVGGVAGGASCAARARRLSETAEIIMFERGPYVSFANCGLPYYIGNVITRKDDLIVASPELFRQRFNIDVRTESNVCRILPEAKEIEVEDISTGNIYRESYDHLVLSPGSKPIMPKLDGIDLPGIFTLRNIPDMDRIIDWIDRKQVKTAVIVGGGFIGLEIAENLHHRGIQVNIVEMQNQLMPAIDHEMAYFIQDHLNARKVSLHLDSAVSSFKPGDENGISVILDSGQHVSADMVIMSIGVQAETQLAVDAGLKLGKNGGIRVDHQQKTSNDNIWAVGDAVEKINYLTRQSIIAPLAGPANRQGRLVADILMESNSNHRRFRGVQTTAVCGILGMTVASTGLSEKNLNQRNVGLNSCSFQKIYLHPNNHAGYYPGASTVTVKLIFSTEDGRVLGAQAVGTEGVEKRIDVIAAIIQKNGTIYDLADAELCYAPQFGSAKDPVNLAGMIATNILDGYVSVAHWDEIANSDALLIDVREVSEFKDRHIKNALNFPLSTLRTQMTELPKDREILIYCLVGQRSYYAARMLALNGYSVRNLSGGFLMHLAYEKRYADV